MAEKTYIRFMHAVPDGPAVDIYFDDDIVVEDLRYSKFTPYFSVDPGKYTVSVYKSGTSEEIILQNNVIVPEDSIYTIAIINLPTNPQLFPIEDPKEEIPEGKAAVRFGHFAPTAPSVDITLPNGTILFKDVSYKEVTDYEFVDPGKYAVDVRPTGTDTVVLQVPNINLKPNRFYSIYAIGLLEREPYLSVVIPLDGNSYLM